MTTEAERPLRADAARNVGRILDAARAAFAELGPEAPLEVIAQRANVGPRTLYRHFPHKEALVRAALRGSITEQLGPVIERALAGDDARAGLVEAMEATLRLVARERNTLAAAANSGALTVEVTAPVLDSLARLTERAQAAGQVRDDLSGDDLARIMGMLTNVLWGMEPGSEGWRRYLALVLDALDPGAAHPLPPGPDGACGAHPCVPGGTPTS